MHAIFLPLALPWSSGSPAVQLSHCQFLPRLLNRRLSHVDAWISGLASPQLLRAAIDQFGVDVAALGRSRRRARAMRSTVHGVARICCRARILDFYHVALSSASLSRRP